jgi:hypothetical protein
MTSYTTLMSSDGKVTSGFWARQFSNKVTTTQLIFDVSFLALHSLPGEEPFAFAKDVYPSHDNQKPAGQLVEVAATPTLFLVH